MTVSDDDQLISNKLDKKSKLFNAAASPKEQISFFKLKFCMYPSLLNFSMIPLSEESEQTLLHQIH